MFKRKKGLDEARFQELLRETQQGVAQPTAREVLALDDRQKALIRQANEQREAMHRPHGR